MKKLLSAIWAKALAFLLMDKKMIQAPVNEYFGPGAYEAVINSSVQIHHPEYWQAREKAISEQNRQAKKKGRER